MTIQKINNSNIKQKPFGSIENQKKANTISPNSIMSTTIVTLVGVGTATSVIAATKKVKHPIFYGFEFGAACAFITKLGLDIYNCFQASKMK